MKFWYNGYQFCKAISEEEKNLLQVYNPTSILLCFEEGEFDNFWMQTGVPNFLPDLIKSQQLPVSEIEEIEMNRDEMKIYDISQIKVLPLLLQTGYLTISSYNAETETYRLRYPNQEIKSSFLQDLLVTFTKKGHAKLKTALVELVHALKKNDLPAFIESLKVIFANIPYDIQIDKEKYYQTLFYLTLYLLGTHIGVEVRTNKGRIDALIETSSYLYLFEFKINSTAQEALDQIKETEYYQKFLLSPKLKILIGVNFDTEQRNIDTWTSKAYENSGREEK